MDLYLLSDTMPIRLYRIPTEQGVLITYGSREDGLVGIGIYGPSIRP
jgi:hypothetical protein